jgi:hypothetical protein
MNNKPNPYKQRMKPKEAKEISIMKLPPTTSEEVAYSQVQDDRALINAICYYSNTLRSAGVAVHKRIQNVIHTSLGYFFSMYEEDKVMVESGLFKPEE